jgi:NADPH2:quinone reductase
MKAWAIKKFGGVNVFEKTKAAKRSIDDQMVRVDVAAVGVNDLDLRIRKGLHPYLVDKFPFVLHGNVSGRVTEIGDGVFDLRVGDEVYGFVGGMNEFPGGLQEEVVVPANLLAKKPRTLLLEEAAALPYSVIVATLMVFEYTQIKPGNKVLVIDGLNSIGCMATQLAKHMKTKVFTTIQEEKEREEVSSYLADEVINLSKVSIEQAVDKHTAGDGFSVVVDPIGDDNLLESFKAASVFGTIATNNTKTTCDLSLLNQKSLNLHVVNLLSLIQTRKVGKKYQEILNDFALMIDRGDINLRIDKTVFYFDDVAKAHSYLESGKAMGDVFLRAK